MCKRIDGTHAYDIDIHFVVNHCHHSQLAYRYKRLAKAFTLAKNIGAKDLFMVSQDH